MFKDLLSIDRPHFGKAPFFALFRLRFLLYGALAALMLAAFIYIDYFGFTPTIPIRTIDSLLTLGAFWLLLTLPRSALFWAGFFTGLLWFYWIAFSFRYYDVAWFIPFMLLFVALAYGIFFWIVGLFDHPLPRALLLLGFSYFHPLSFNWFIPELSLIHTFFGIQKWRFALLLLTLVIAAGVKGWWRLLALLALIGAVDPRYDRHLPLPETRVMLTDSMVPQEKKWDPDYLPETIENNLATILQAISEKYDMVVLDESVFPMFLNTDLNLTRKLQDLSHDIVIVAGALYSDGKDAYNSTYYFDKGKIYIANKVILVPFGEEIPLPRFLAKWINDHFYNGAEDYRTASRPVDLKLSTGTYRNAICFEATREELFAGDPPLMIAVSNNAWFTPSIEPTLQKLLLEYFGKRHHTVIYHSANHGISTIIR